MFLHKQYLKPKSRLTSLSNGVRKLQVLADSPECFKEYMWILYTPALCWIFSLSLSFFIQIVPVSLMCTIVAGQEARLNKRRIGIKLKLQRAKGSGNTRSAAQRQFWASILQDQELASSSLKWCLNEHRCCHGVLSFPTRSYSEQSQQLLIYKIIWNVLLSNPSV